MADSKIDVKLNLDASGVKAGMDDVAKSVEKTSSAGKAALGKANTALAGMQGAAAAASGTFGGAAGGIGAMTRAMQEFGVAASAAETAAFGIGAAMAVYATVQKILAKISADAKAIARIQFDNLASAGERIADGWSKAAREMERTSAAMKALRETGAEDKDIEHEQKLADLELKRQNALKNTSTADGRAAVNKDFDARVREENLRYSSAKAKSEESALRSDQDDARKRAAAARSESEDWMAKASEARAKATELAAAAAASWRSDPSGRKREEAAAQSKEWAAKDAEYTRRAAEAAETAKDYDQQAIAIGDKIGQATARANIEATRIAAEAVAAEIPEIVSDAGGSGETKAPAAGLGPIDVSTDRLARIGGFVGGAGSAVSVQTKQLSVAEAQKKILEDFYRNWQARPNATVLA